MARSPGGQEVGRISVRVLPNTDQFRADLKVALEKLERGLAVEVDVKVDTKQAVAQTKAVRSHLDRALDDVTFTVDFDISRTEAAFGLAAARALSMADRVGDVLKRTRETVKQTANLRQHWRNVESRIRAIPARLNKIRTDGLYRNIVRVSDAALNLGTRMRRLGGTVGRVFQRLARGNVDDTADGITNLGRQAEFTGRRFLGLSRIGWLVAGAFAGAAPAIGLVSGVLAGVPSLLAAAVAPVSAITLGFDGIREAASQLGPQFDALKQSLSGTFAQQLTPVFRDLGTLFPILDVGLNQVAVGVSDMARGFTDVVTSASGMSQIQTILANTGAFLTDLAPTVRHGTSAFLTLAEAGSSSFGLLSGVLNTFAQNFDAMVQRVTGNGTFAKAMQSLALVAGAVLDTFTRVFEAGLGSLGDLGAPLATLVSGIGDALVALMPSLTALASLVASVLGEGLSAIAPAIENLTPAFTQLASLLGGTLIGAIRAVAPLLATVAEVVNTVLVQALDAVAPILPPITRFLTQLAEVLGDFLVDALTALQPLITLLIDFFAQVLVAIQPLLPQLLELAKTVFKALLDALIRLTPLLLELAQMVLPILIEAVQLLVSIFSQIAPTLGSIITAVVGFVTTIAEVLAPVFQGILQVVQAVWPSIKNIIQGVLTAIQGVINLVLGLITGDWSRAWEGIKQIFSGAWQAIQGAVSAGINAVVSFFANLPGAILGALGDLGGLLVDVGSNLLQGLWQGIQNAADWLLQKVGQFFSDLLPGWVKDMLGISSPSKVFADIGKWVPLGFAQGIQATTGRAAGAARQMAHNAMSSFALGSSPRLAGRSAAASFATGLADGKPAALATADDLASLLGGRASADWNAHIASDGFGGLADAVTTALEGWTVELDSNGLARLVNKANTRRARRG